MDRFNTLVTTVTIPLSTHGNLFPYFHIINLHFIDGVGENIVEVYVGKLDCHNFATINALMPSCTPSNNCTAMIQFYIY